MTISAEEGLGYQRDGLLTDGSPLRDRWLVNASNPVRYEVRFSQDLLHPDNPALADAGAPGTGSGTGCRRFLVVDSNVHERYGSRITGYLEARGIGYEVCVIVAHEQLKTMDSVFRVLSAMDDFGLARRREPVIAVGGGVLTDIVGVAAGMYRRSTPYVRVPTTLIGMVDAAVGAKTGINLGRHKNRLGSYHPSVVTLIDPAFLRSLHTRHLSNGLAEILKIALIKDRDLFDLLAEHGSRLAEEHFRHEGSADGGAAAATVLRRAIHGMLEELQSDLWERELRRLMDYGHSFSPTIEMEALPALLHGEAVCVDMAFTTLLARRRGLLGAEEYRRIIALMHALDLPTWHPLCTPELLSRALADTVRHRDGRQHIPLPVGIGRGCFVDDLTDVELADTAAQFRHEHALRAAVGGDHD